MAKQTISIGASSNDHTGDPLRTAFTKVNANFTELYTSSGSTGNFTFSADTITNTLLVDDPGVMFTVADVTSVYDVAVVELPPDVLLITV